jgi:hypothetical protein
MRLSPEKLESLQQALLDSFDLGDMRVMLALKLGRNIQDLAEKGKRPEVFLSILEEAQKDEWIGSLLAGALDFRPGNRLLREVAGGSLAPPIAALESQGEKAREFESKVRAANPEFDFLLWLRKAEKVQPQLCRIQYPASKGGTVSGTGFLVGPDKVLTNQHVIDELVEGDKARILFDHIFLTNTTLSEGVTFRLADKWLLASSPPSRFDEERRPKGVPSLNELDFALLQLSAPAGNEPAGTNDHGGTRGWLKLPLEEQALVPHDPLIILQHPDGLPLRAAMETDSVIDTNANRTRIRHRTNTDNGSSGSPCFDMGWNLVALHHVGDPNFKGPGEPENAAIPIHLIGRSIAEQGIEVDKLS